MYTRSVVIHIFSKSKSHIVLKQPYHIIICVFIEDIVEVEVMLLYVLCEINFVPKPKLT